MNQISTDKIPKTLTFSITPTLYRWLFKMGEITGLKHSTIICSGLKDKLRELQKLYENHLHEKR